MDRDEFERIKQAEKEHLREKKRLQSTLRTLKRERRVQGAVAAMTRRANALLRENEALTSALSADAAHAAARLDVALDRVESVDSVEWPEQSAAPEPPQDRVPNLDGETDDDVESRAEQLVQQMKMASGPQHRRGGDARRRTPTERPSHPVHTDAHRRNAASDDADDEDDRSSETDRPSGVPTDTLPEKTMGRVSETDDTEGPPSTR